MMMKSKALKFIGCLFAFMPMLAWAGSVEQLRQFLDGTKTLRADFSQTVVAKNGRKPQQSSGTVAISRPGKLRWEIKKPYPQIMVGDGEKFWIYDEELAQVTVKKVTQAIGGTPAALLAGGNVLERDFTLKDGGESDNLSWVEATPKNTESGFEKVRLGFAGSELRGMELRDNFGQTTYLRFTKIERNPSLSAGLFHFKPPAGADVIGE
ncbi:MAG: outer membrane lipoprotein chaperone LolA [Betaproteobacteria bacterium]